MIPHPVTPDLLPALYRLNQDNAVALSSLTEVEFRHMTVSATYARAAGGDGFMLCFDEGSAYDSTNFLWFCARYRHFIYVDRIVIAPERRGEGLARLFYNDLFDWARQAGHERIVAEFNTDPPNPASDAFHAALGFETVGEQHLVDRGKSVRYVSRPL